MLFGLCILFFGQALSFLTDWWFFVQMGYQQIIVTSLSSRLIIGCVVFLISLIWFFTHILIASRATQNILIMIPRAWLGTAVDFVTNFSRRVLLIGSVILSFVLALGFSSNWFTILRFINSVSFNTNDPLFNKDISFYVFKVPFYNLVIQFGITLLFLTLIGVLILSLLKIGKRMLGQRTLSAFMSSIDKGTRIHVGLLILVLFILFSLQSYFSIFSLVYSDNLVYGAGFTDVTALIPLKYISIVLMGLAGIFLCFSIITNRIKGIIFISVLIVINSVLQVVIPGFIQQFIVSPNELAKETPYILKNIDATLKGYNLDSVEVKSLKADKKLTQQNIVSNEVTMKNVRLWDRAPLLSTFSQIQEIRTYYEFGQIDNSRYIIDGEPRQIMISAREMATNSLPSQTWINRHLTFTHGYGIAASPVNQVTTQGLPVLFARDIPTKSSYPELTLTRPEIYYGELTNDYIITNAKTKEFSYPKGEENIYANYEGNGGVPMDSFFKKILYALRTGSIELLFSSDITNQSRIHLYRNIVERVQTIAPFIHLDNDPYIVVNDGKLYWIIDGYTMTNRYPYSQPSTYNGESMNYIRNSVKVVIDAYNGTTSYYISDKTDPLIQTIARIFPNVFKDLSTISAGLKSQIRYPEDIFKLQSDIYRTYHMNQAQNFYNREDQWEIPSIASDQVVQAGETDVTAVAPRHLVMKLPGETKEEYVFMQPFTPRGKDNLSAWLVARNDGENYGKLRVYRFPKDSLVYGPKQIIARINQEPSISQQITLWDQHGSQVIQGPLLVIPIDESVLYIRALYLQAENGKIPELKRVIVAYEDMIAMEDTLSNALAKIFGVTSQSVKESSQNSEISPTPSVPNTIHTDQSNITLEAQSLYDSAIQAQKDGDWTTYGEKIKKLGEILKQMKNK